MGSKILAAVLLLCSVDCWAEDAYKPRWSDGTSLTDVGESVEKILANADQEGLDPGDYADGLRAFKEFRNGRGSVEADYQINAAMVQYIDDVYNGRFMPSKVAKKIVIKPDPVDPEYLISQGLSEGGTDWMDRLPPQSSQYKLLKAALAQYPKNRDQIIATMERWRWMPRSLSSRYVLVNIARYELRAFSDGSEVMRSRIIVGKPYSQTPVFAAELHSVVFNPSWYVPASIVGEIERKGSPASRGFVSNGRGGWIQPPGERNALGKIKFTINEKGQEGNRFNVYLHSTSSKELFKNDNRGLSHGCIRVQDVVDLAKFVFNGSMDEDGIKNSMKGSATSVRRLEEKIPVLITYFTAWANEDGTVDFGKDIYKQDQKLLGMIKG